MNSIDKKSNLTFRFGTAPAPGGYHICSSARYNPQTGYGFLPPAQVKLRDGADYVCGDNVRRTITDTEGQILSVTWEYPVFVVDLPIGIYEVRLIQTAPENDRAVNGASIQGNLYAVRWFRDGIPTSYAQPAESSWIWTGAGEEKESSCIAAVTDGQLRIELATWLRDNGDSGTTYLKEISVTRKDQITQPSTRPTLRFIGDSTLAKYPPQDGGVWIPLPERTGWGEDFSMGRFTDNQLILDNRAVAGSSLKSYRYEGFLNDFFLNCHPGDTVIVESGINDNAPGRRFSTAAEFENGLSRLIDGCLAFDQKIILCSGTGSAPEYVEKIAALAKTYQLPYVNLLQLWTDYLTRRAPLDLTVDGTHLSRIGGIVAAQLVANAISPLEGLSITGHLHPLPPSTEPTRLRVEHLQVAAQTQNSITLAWDLDESLLYEPQNLITGFQLYRAEAPNAAPVPAGSQSTYVSAGMEGPKMRVTLDVPSNREYLYYIACQSVNGEGPLSAPLPVPAFYPDDSCLLRELCAKLHSAYYPEAAFTAASYGKMKEALDGAEQILTAGHENAAKALRTLQDAVAGLEPQARFLVREDFQSEPPAAAPWGVEGTHANLLSCRIDETGNRTLHLYVEAAGERFVKKSFPHAREISASHLTVAFEWYPGKPDRRNCTEIEFYSGSEERLLSLKASDNGHIGFVTGSYDAEDTAYLTGSGFHDYENSQAVDMGLPTQDWYQVQITFHFVSGTMDLAVAPRYGSFAQTQVSFQGIPMPFCSVRTITSMAFLLKRGKQDNGVTNDLSILWSTDIDNFVMFYRE